MAGFCYCARLTCFHAFSIVQNTHYEAFAVKAGRKRYAYLVAKMSTQTISGKTEGVGSFSIAGMGESRDCGST